MHFRPYQKKILSKIEAIDLPIPIRSNRGHDAFATNDLCILEQISSDFVALRYQCAGPEKPAIGCSDHRPQPPFFQNGRTKSWRAQPALLWILYNTPKKK